MDERWRNLGIIVIIVILGLLVFNFNQILDLTKNPVDNDQTDSNIINLERDQMFTEILNVFENNTVDLNSLRYLENISYVNGSVEFKESKTELDSVKRDLAKLSSQLDSKYDYNISTEGKEIINVYIAAIDFTNFEASSITQINQIANLSQSNACENIDLLIDVNSLMTQRYDKLWDLVDLMSEYMFEYDIFSEIIIVDYDREEFNETQFITSANEFVEYCGDLNE